MVIQISEETAGKLPLLTLDIPDNAFRRFLLLALRTELSANRLKQIWSRGRLLSGTLEALSVPVLVDASALLNLEKIVTAKKRWGKLLGVIQISAPA